MTLPASYLVTYRFSADAEERLTRLSYSEEPGPLHAQTGKRGRYCYEGDWLQGAATPGAIFQQLHAKCPVREGGHLILSDAEGKALYAHPRPLAAELGCKSHLDLVPLEVESHRERQTRVKASKESAKSRKLEGWF